MLCSVVKHLGSGSALKKWGKTLDCVSCFPLHFFRALPLPAYFTTEQNTAEASLFVNYFNNILDNFILPTNIENPTTGRKIRIFFYCVKKTLLVNYF